MSSVDRVCLQNLLELAGHTWAPPAQVQPTSCPWHVAGPAGHMAPVAITHEQPLYPTSLKLAYMLPCPVPRSRAPCVPS